MNVKNGNFNHDQTIDCEYQHPDFGWIPFTADPNDPEELGREIYRRAVNGEFGKIKPYQEAVKTQTELGSEIREQRDYMMASVDHYVSNPLRWAELSDDRKNVIAEYRTDLLNVPQQTGFPETIEWPEIPEELK